VWKKVQGYLQVTELQQMDRERKDEIQKMDHKYEDSIQMIKSCNNAKQSILSRICQMKNAPVSNDFDIDEHIAKRKFEIGLEKMERK
jgi:hypothetical protein